jgi:O-antigen/teichoic acid export membrane protein
MLSRSVALNILGGLGSLAVGFATSIVLARWLGAADRGLLGIMVTAAGVALALAGLGLPMSVMYFASRKDSDGPALLANSTLHAAVLALFLIPGAWALRGPLASAFAGGHGGRVWILAAVLVPVTLLDWTTHNQLLGELRFGLYNSLVILSKVATLVLVVTLIGVWHLGVGAALLATMAASVVMIAGSLPTILAHGSPRLRLSLYRRLVSYGVRVQAGSVLQILNYRLDILVLGLFVPLRQVGYYFVAEFLAELVVTIANAFQSSVLPLVARQESRGEQDSTTIAAIRHHTILALAATAANAVFAPIVILFALTSGYRPAIVPFFILLPSMVFLGLGTVVQSDLRGRGRPGLSSAYAGVAVAVTVLFDFALIPPFGVVGAAIASVCAYVAYGVASLRGLSRVTGIPVRTLAVPTRADLALYKTVPSRVLGRDRAAAAPVENT